MKKTHVPIALEGYPFILFCAFTTLILGLLELKIAAIIGIALTAFVTWFFRDPERISPDNPDAFISPADGKIILIEKILDDRFAGDQVHKVSIFMNVFNVHVNRLPYRGTIQNITLQPGKFYSADSRKGALQNEYCSMTVMTDNKLTYGVVQVAGLIARRIVCWAEKGDALQTGQRYGLIRFGSRVDLYLPLQVNIQITQGDKVKAGETVLGVITQSRNAV